MLKKRLKKVKWIPCHIERDCVICGKSFNLKNFLDERDLCQDCSNEINGIIDAINSN